MLSGPDFDSASKPEDSRLSERQGDELQLDDNEGLDLEECTQNGRDPDDEDEQLSTRANF